MKIIDKFLNETTMYRLLTYTLILLSIYSLAMSLFGLIYYSPLELLVSIIVLVSVSFIAHCIFKIVFDAPSSIESTLITSLILFFIIEPLNDVNNILWTSVIAFASVATKYILSYNNKHLFNPAAISVLIAGLFQFGGATWWIGTVQMFAPILICGLLIVRKIRRYDTFITYILISTITVTTFQLLNGGTIYTSLHQHFISWPTLFFATFMLTEPLTTPPTRNLRIIYATIAGVLSSFPFGIGFIHSSPELALVVANIFAYTVSIKSRLTLRLKEKIKLTADAYEFVFTKNHAFNFKAGQYLEWTLPHESHDDRGTKRYFTIASAPHEKEIRVAIKAGENLSTFKQKLLDLKIGSKVFVTNLSGDFTLKQKKELVFIAGGIGITPFISMIREAIKNQEGLDAVLFYANKNQNQIAYKDLLDFAEKSIHIKVVYLSDVLNREILEKYCCDFDNRKYYISGPNGMVLAYKKLLIENNISSNNIKTDYFPGFA